MKTQSIAITLLCMLALASSSNCFLTGINILLQKWNNKPFSEKVISECKKLTSIFARGGKCNRIVQAARDQYSAQNYSLEKTVAFTLCRAYGRGVFKLTQRKVASKYGFC